MRKIRKLKLHNSKPEVDFDFVPTAFITPRLALKADVMNFSQMAPQER